MLPATEIFECKSILLLQHPNLCLRTYSSPKRDYTGVVFRCGDKKCMGKITRILLSFASDKLKDICICLTVHEEILDSQLFNNIYNVFYKEVFS